VLFRLWRTGRVSDIMLPALLHRLEPHLSWIDFGPLPPALAMAIVAAIALAPLLAIIANSDWPRGAIASVDPVLGLVAAITAAAIIIVAVLFLRPRLRERRHVSLIRNQLPGSW